MPLSSFFDSVAKSDLATAINQAPYTVGALSSVHLLGLTLIVGSVILVCLRSFGVVLPDVPLADVMRPAGKVVLIGFAISLTSGLLMFAPRALTAYVTSSFQIKMALVVVAMTYHFALFRPAARRPERRSWPRLTAILGVGLWFAIAYYGCIFAVFD
jgi:hypothetical protein